MAETHLSPRRSDSLRDWDFEITVLPPPPCVEVLGGLSVELTAVLVVLACWPVSVAAGATPALAPSLEHTLPICSGRGAASPKSGPLVRDGDHKSIEARV